MKLLSVEGSNVGLLKGSFEFKFGGALTTITGPIGCGKSTLLTMIKASLTNSVPGSGSSWVSWGIKDSEPSFFTSIWELNNNIIEITKPLADNNAFKVLNIPRIRIATTEGETLEEVFTAREANDLMVSLLPVSTKVIDSHLIIDQDQITYPASATPAKFQETIHVLTKVNEMEVARSKVRESLSSYTVPQVSEEVIRLKSDSIVIEQEVSTSTQRQEDIHKELSGLDVHSVVNELALLQEAESNSEKSSKVVAELSSLKDQKSLMESRLDHMLKEKVGTLEKHQKYEPLAKQASELLAKYEYLVKDWEEKVSLTETESVQQKELNELVIPTRPVGEAPDEKQLEVLQNHKNSISVLLESNDKKIKLVDLGRCHECGQTTDSIDKKSLQEESRAYTHCLTEITDLTLAVQNQAKEFESYSLATDMYDISKANLVDALQDTQTRLQAVVNAKEVSESDKALWNSVTETFEALAKGVDVLENNISNCKTRIEVYENGISNATQTLTMLQGSAKPDSIRLKVLLGQQEYINALNQESLMLQGLIQGKNEELERVSGKLAALQTREASVEPIKDYRGILERAAEVLHKTGLPKLISAQYLHEINSKLGEYLEMVEADFSAWIDQDLQFTVKKSDGLVHRANRLSGGQKQQASISYLLAVNDVFANSLGVLALDEPTGSMQEENAKDIAEAFSKLLQIGKQTKRQFIVITHSETLASYGEVRIDLRGYL
jgi:DNA repair exonuclease SbcCD ATPase subunit